MYLDLLSKKDIDTKCQIFTPPNYVKKLLDLVGYSNNILGKKILENSCGDGNILIQIVKRYILEALNQKYSFDEIKEGLENNIYGFEIDQTQYQKCIDNLNLITLEYGIFDVEWKIYNIDYLKSQLNIKFDFIVGNPPYRSYVDLQLSERNFIRENFETCKYGKFDYCYAFIEKSINSLSSEGKMSYLIPSGIYKTVFGKKLREFIKPYVVKILDYTKEKIFNNALVKTSIVVLDKTIKDRKIYYFDVSTNHQVSLEKNNMTEKWVFSNDFNIGEKKFGDYFQVSYAPATLLNEAYIINEKALIETNNHFEFENAIIEKDMLFPAAAPRSVRFGKSKKIIFPYKYENGKLLRFQEKEFQNQYPGTFLYLTKFKDKLKKRKTNANAKWYEYGRNQSLAKIKCKKLLISTIITDKVYVHLLEENCIPYSGMFVTLKKSNKEYDLKFAKALLESEKFMIYLRKIASNVSGSSLKITSRDIEKFKFDP